LGRQCVPGRESFVIGCCLIVEVKVDTVPRGNTNYVQDNMFLGQLPKRLVFGCVDSDALNGTITKIPFDFKHYNINFVALNVGGLQIHPNKVFPLAYSSLEMVFPSS
jgi:hypothetical protein